MIDDLRKTARQDFKIPPESSFSFLIHSGLEVITLLVILEKKEVPLGVLRMARDPLNQSLAREHEILSHIQGLASPDFLQSIPAPLGLHLLHGLPALSLSFLEGQKMTALKKPKVAVGELFKKIRVWIVHLNRLPAGTGKQKSSRFFEARKRINRLAGRYPEEPELLRILKWVSQYDSPEISASIPTVITHRDLAPTNVLFQGDELKVVDWGNSHYGYPLTDWVRFACNSLSMLHGAGHLRDSLQDLLLGSSEISRMFYQETKELCRENALRREWIAPLFLLSLFDFLESYHLSRADSGWEENFSFILSSQQWLNRLVPFSI